MTAERGSVLIVEDDIDMGILLKTILERKLPDLKPDGVIHVKSATEAEEMLSSGADPFFIITTIDLGPYTNMDGKKMIEKLRRPDSLYRETPILIYSGYEFSDLKWKLPDKTKYLRKPATVEEIEEAIETVMSFREAEHD